VLRLQWLGVCALVGALAFLAFAGENLDTERQITDLRVDERHPASPDQGDRVAVFPLITYSPDEGIAGGAKFVDRDLTSAHMTLDVLGLYAERQTEDFELTLALPRLGTDRWLGLLEASYFTDRSKQFFGLGNDNTGSRELSTNEIRNVNALLTLGFRLSPTWTLAASGGVIHTTVRRGRLESGRPSTGELFPKLAGIHGGYTDPISLSLVFDDRNDLVRPTNGEYLIAKIQHVDPLLGGGSRYTRFLLDGGMLRPIHGPRSVLGLRVAGEYIEGSTRDIPFYELAALGSATDLRGFFLDRFLGRGRAFANAEVRRELCDLTVRDWWHARLDGVIFGDAGRVFFGSSDVKRALGETVAPRERLTQTVRVSYGTGLRLALDEALVIRLDVGFSNEETALVYLDFGQTF
jgi:outer membrane protein assembly factor BamA